MKWFDSSSRWLWRACAYSGGYLLAVDAAAWFCDLVGRSLGRVQVSATCCLVLGSCNPASDNGSGEPFHRVELSSSVPDAPALPPLFELTGDTVSAGYAEGSRVWMEEFSYTLPKPRAWVNFLEARDACRVQDLDLCSVPQWERMCAQAHDVAQLETWTTSYFATGDVWVRGGGHCSKALRAPVEERTPTRVGVCCQRRVAIDLPEQKGEKLARAAHGHMDAVQRTMTSRDPEAILAMTTEEFYLYSSKTMRTRQEARKLLRYDLVNGSEFDPRLVLCEARMAAGGKEGSFDCESVIVSKYDAEPVRKIAFVSMSFRFVPPHLRYDKWGVGTGFARKPAPLVTGVAVTRGTVER